MLKTLLVKAAFIAFVGSVSFAAHAIADTQRFDVPAGDLIAALESFAKQADVDLVYQDEQVKGHHTRGLRGTFTAEEAVTKLLEGTPLTVRKDSSGAMLIAPPKPAPATTSSRTGEGETRATESTRFAQNNSSPGTGQEGARDSGQVRESEERYESQELPAPEETGKAIPEILVRGSVTLNTDIRRTPDDIQPYVVFERETIERSGTNSMEEFLKQRLTANVTTTSNQQGASFNSGNISSINLRGLGATQTLVLIDGHRVAGQLVGTGGAFNQPDLNGIPLAAIERIEVLPTTASGIYGGGATGGVVNVILRRDYEGSELRLTYDNSVDTDSFIRRADVSSGFVLEEGKTSVLLAASYADGSELMTRDRNFVRRARETIVRNLGSPVTLEGATDPPLGATVNVRSVNGSPLFGPATSNITFLPPGYTTAAGLGPLLANAGQYNLDLADAANAGTSNGGGGGGSFGLGSVPTVESLGITIRRQFSPDVELFIDAAAANNSSVGWANAGTNRFTIPASAPTNPFGQAVRVTVPVPVADSPNSVDLRSRRAIVGLLFGLPREWQSGLDYSWSRTSYHNQSARTMFPTVTAAVANGTLDVLRDPSSIDFSPYLAPAGYTEPYPLTLQSGVWRVSGPLWELPAGALTLTGLIEHREEEIGDGFTHSFSANRTFYAPSRSQTVSGAYLEALVPLVSTRNAFRGVKELEVQLAARYDDYRLHGANTINFPLDTPIPTASIVRSTNHGDALSPTIGLKYIPADDLALRASYGTGYLPPNLYQLTPTEPTFSSTPLFSDPRRGGTPVPAGLGTSIGGNPNLTPEDSENWSVGGILTPSLVPGLRLSVDYVEIRKRDNIATLTPQQIIDNEAFLPGRITRGANLPGDQPGWPGPITFIDATSVNLSRTLVAAYDVALDYHHRTPAWGSFDFYAAATRFTHYKNQVTPAAAEIEGAGVAGVALGAVPLKLKANAGVTWKHGSWTAGWNARYFDSYVVVHPSLSTSATIYLRQGSTRVDSQTYHDLFAAYRFGQHGWLENAQLQMGIRNVLDTEPPLDVNSTTNLYSTFGDPRLRTYYLTLAMNF